MQDRPSDQDLLQQILQGGQAANSGLKKLYADYRQSTLAYLYKQGAKQEEAKDIFQDGVIAVFENIVSRKFRGESSLGSYLKGVCRYLFLNRIRRQKRELEILGTQAEPNPIPSPLPKLLKAEARQEIKAILNELGANCQETLTLSIYYDYSMKELAEHLSYANEQIARNKKYRCLEKLRKLVKKSPQVIKWLHA